MKTYFTNINIFTKVTRWLKNSALQLLQFDIWQKFRQRVSKALNCKSQAENLRKYISTIAGKIYFANIISFTKVTWLSQNSDLQLLQFDIPCMYQNACILYQRSQNIQYIQKNLENAFGRQQWKFSFKIWQFYKGNVHCLKTVICSCSSLIFDKNAGNMYHRP